ncbi:MAG: HlyD family efflux transporter periplasmic adaptor subunit [Caldilineaceae bacterium]|nr:HlyD family efflux transporter periplasmic adaptor subunit [Caldilineaceae bacterium]
MIREKLLQIGTTLAATMVISGCSLLPANRTQLAAADAPTPTPIPTPVVPVKPTYKVQRGEIVDEITFSGRISPVTEEELFFRATGRVRAVFVRRNDMVEVGQVLAELEIDGLERELQSAQLQLERAKVLLEQAERDWDYQKEVAQINLEKTQTRLANLQGQAAPDAAALTAQEFEVRLAQLSLDKVIDEGINPLLVNDVTRAEYDVTKLNAEIAEAQIIAPFDGQLLSLSLSPGQAVEAFRPVATVADINDLEVTADLLSNQMEDLAEEMTVNVVLVSRPGVELTGSIRQLPYPYGSGGSATATIEDRDKSTRFTLDQSAEEAGFDLGDLVRVTVELERKEDILWVPPQAVRVFDGRRFAVVIDGEARRRVDVKVGIETPDRLEIEEGLEEGQVIEGQ